VGFDCAAVEPGEERGITSQNCVFEEFSAGLPGHEPAIARNAEAHFFAVNEFQGERLFERFFEKDFAVEIAVAVFVHAEPLGEA